MTVKIVNTRGNVIAKLGIGCVVCLLLGFGVLLHAQEKTKTAFIGTKPDMNPAKIQAMLKAKEQAETQRNRFGQRRQREKIDFGQNEAFYKMIIDNNLFRPLGWRPANNEPAFSLVGTAINPNGTLSQATLLEKRSNRYHFVTIGTKLGDMTVKDIQAKQVTLDKAGDTITLKTGTLQFLTTKRGRGDRYARSGESEKAGNNPGQNQANAKDMEAAKQKQMEMEKEKKAAFRMNKDMAEKLKNASPEERQEIMREFRRRASSRRGGDRRGRGRDR